MARKVKTSKQDDSILCVVGEKKRHLPQEDCALGGVADLIPSPITALLPPPPGLHLCHQHSSIALTAAIALLTLLLLQVRVQLRWWGWQHRGSREWGPGSAREHHHWDGDCIRQNVLDWPLHPSTTTFSHEDIAAWYVPLFYSFPFLPMPDSLSYTSPPDSS